MDTNEGALANVLATAYSEPGFYPEKECLITLPPTASTAINCFFLLPLFMGMTVRIDPRADEENFLKLMLEYKPSLSCSTGSLWYSFCRRLNVMLESGKNVDLSFSDTCILGGSGVTPEQLGYINDTLIKCHAKHRLDCGYGCSEFFGVITVDKHEVDYKPLPIEVIDVGIPIPGAVLGVFDEEGNELPFGERGEIRAKGPSIMHGYFGKPEITKKAFEGEWLRTGDIGIIDENGYIYCYGRMKSSIEIDGRTIYLFDVANDLRKRFNLEDCMVEVKKLADSGQSVVVYYVQNKESRIDESKICIDMNAYTSAQGITIDGYREFETAFPISATTLKPKTRYADGFVNFTDNGDKKIIYFSSTKEDDIWELHEDVKKP